MESRQARRRQRNSSSSLSRDDDTHEQQQEQVVDVETEQRRRLLTEADGGAGGGVRGRPRSSRTVRPPRPDDVTMEENDDEDVGNVDEVDLNDEESGFCKFRKVLPGSKVNRGRPISLVLHSRSICGHRMVGGVGRGAAYISSLPCTGCTGSEVVLCGRKKVGEHVKVSSSLASSPKSVASKGDNDGDEVSGGDGEEQPVPPENGWTPTSDGDDEGNPVVRSEFSVDSVDDQYVEKNHEESKVMEDVSACPPRRLGLNAYPATVTREIQNFAEYRSVLSFRASYLDDMGGVGPVARSSLRRNLDSHSKPLKPAGESSSASPSTSSSAVSTISIAFSPDGRTLASTHGDHSVKITCTATGKLVRNLEGHPRTPWTVKYHPTKSNVVASGCLGFQVRVWDWNWRSSTRRRSLMQRRKAREGVGYRNRPSSSNKDGADDAQFRSGGDELDGADDDDYDTQYNYHERIGVCLNMIRLQYAIISLSFHPSALILAVASGSSLHLWDYGDHAGFLRRKRAEQQEEEKEKERERKLFQQTSDGSRDDVPLATNMPSDSGGRQANSAHLSLSNGQPTARSSVISSSSASSSSQRRRNRLANHRNTTLSSSSDHQHHRNQRGSGTVSELRHEHALRCVHFPPSGNTIIVGGVNPPTPPTNSDHRQGRSGMSGGGMSFSLRLYDFDLDAALFPEGGMGTGGRRVGIREAMTNSRTFVPRALLYNDGGFDVSPDGSVLCACAEYWLPDGVDNAMDFLHRGDDEDSNHQRGRNDLGGNASSGFSSPTAEGSKATSAMETNQCGGDASASISSDQGAASFSSPPRQRIPVVAPPPVALDPKTPPNQTQPNIPLSPPSPPGRRFPGGLGQRTSKGVGASRRSSAGRHSSRGGGRHGLAAPGRQSIPPPPPPPNPHHHPHPLAMIGGMTNQAYGPVGGRYVPHVVTVSLNTTASTSGSSPQHWGQQTGPGNTAPTLGQLLEAAPLDGTKASGVTCVKFSPNAEFCLLGYGVRENAGSSVNEAGQRQERYHPVTALYRIRGGMTHVSTMLSGDDDVNIARFHPESGYGFVYGTKQGRVRLLSSRPWNYYH